MLRNSTSSTKEIEKAASETDLNTLSAVSRSIYSPIKPKSDSLISQTPSQIRYRARETIRLNTMESRQKSDVITSEDKINLLRDPTKENFRSSSKSILTKFRTKKGISSSMPHGSLSGQLNIRCDSLERVEEIPDEDSDESFESRNPVSLELHQTCSLETKPSLVVAMLNPVSIDGSKAMDQLSQSKVGDSIYGSILDDRDVNLAKNDPVELIDLQSEKDIIIQHLIYEFVNSLPWKVSRYFFLLQPQSSVSN